MSVFKKTCFQCGIKVDKLIENKCEDCFKVENPPIEDIKPIKLSICNMCNRIHYKHGFFELREIKEMLPNMALKSLTINKNYKLNEIKISNFLLKRNNISFDIEVDCNLKK